MLQDEFTAENEPSKVWPAEDTGILPEDTGILPALNKEHWRLFVRSRVRPSTLQNRLAIIPSHESQTHFFCAQNVRSRSPSETPAQKYKRVERTHPKKSRIGKTRSRHEISARRESREMSALF